MAPLLVLSANQISANQNNVGSNLCAQCTEERSERHLGEKGSDYLQSISSLPRSVLQRGCQPLARTERISSHLVCAKMSPTPTLTSARQLHVLRSLAATTTLNITSMASMSSLFARRLCLWEHRQRSKTFACFPGSLQKKRSGCLYTLTSYICVSQFSFYPNVTTWATATQAWNCLPNVSPALFRCCAPWSWHNLRQLVIFRYSSCSCSSGASSVEIEHVRLNTRATSGIPLSTKGQKKNTSS